MVTPLVLRLFEGYGVELEYMIVHDDTLDVYPLSDELLKAVAGEYEDEVDRGALSWSNELVLHVVELKTNGPVSTLDGLAATFQKDIDQIHALLAPLGARLMPTAAHPWMDPHRETRLWPHGYNAVYATFDRIFDCRGHGWSNLQSTHVNLPFSDDDSFGRLHAAIRAVMPLLPALAASSPFLDGRFTGLRDARLEAYRHNARRIPSVTGRVIPEPVYTPKDYEDQILQPMYRDIAPLDPEKAIQAEWLNARGAIARFDRNTIEIRVLDVQECPRADLAIVRLVTETLRALTEDRWCDAEALRALSVQRLEPILLDTIRDAETAVITDQTYLDVFGRSGPCTAMELWAHVFGQLEGPWGDDAKALRHIFQHGSLASRLLKIVGTNPSREALKSLYCDLCDCLMEGRLYGEEI